MWLLRAGVGLLLPGSFFLKFIKPHRSSDVRVGCATVFVGALRLLIGPMSAAGARVPK